MADYSTKRAARQGTPIFVGTRVVGSVIGDTFVKRIKDAHFLQRPRALASDIDALEQAERAGAQFFEAHHVESGIVYRAPIARFFERGFRVSRGFGEQLALLLSDFDTEAEPMQLALALGG